MSDLAEGRVAVTGAAGFIGRSVVRRLADASVPVVAIVREEDMVPPDLPAEVVRADAGDPDDIEAALAGASHVVHLAARSGGIQVQETDHEAIFLENRRITDAVLRAAVATGVERVLLASSAVVYRKSDAPTIGEESAIVAPGDRPSGYAWSKVTDEVAAGWQSANHGIETVVGRFGNVFGPGASFDPARSTVVHALISRLVDAPEGGTIEVWGDGSAVRSFIYVEDVAGAVTVVLEHGSAGTAYNIDTGRPVTIRDLATMIRDRAAPTVALEFDATKPTGIPTRVPEATRLRSLGFEPAVPLGRGLDETIAAYRRSRDPR